MKRLFALCSFLLISAPALAGSLSLYSDDLYDNRPLTMKQVFQGMGCHGGNLSPGLSWSGEPQGTKSFAITVYDPDAPTGSGWWHWVVINLPAATHELPEAAGTPDGKKLPEGALQLRTDFGAPGYGGPCPPKGDKPHRYIFTLYALKTEKLDIDPQASAAMAGYIIRQNMLDKASLMGTYGR